MKFLIGLAGSGAPVGERPAPASAVPSPCTNVCRLDDACRYCVGCWRTLDEIAGWSRLDDAGKAAVWALIHQRRSDRLDESPSRAP